MPPDCSIWRAGQFRRVHFKLAVDKLPDKTINESAFQSDTLHELIAFRTAKFKQPLEDIVEFPDTAQKTNSDSIRYPRQVRPYCPGALIGLEKQTFPGIDLNPAFPKTFGKNDPASRYPIMPPACPRILYPALHFSRNQFVRFSDGITFNRMDLRLDECVDVSETSDQFVHPIDSQKNFFRGRHDWVPPGNFFFILPRPAGFFKFIK